MKKRKQDPTVVIPSNYTDKWFNDHTTMFFYDKYHSVNLYQKNADGHIQHLTLTPQEYINFTARLQAAGFKNDSRIF